MNYKFDHLIANDIDELCDLFRETYPDNIKLTREYLKWLYFDNPIGAAIGFNARFEGKLIAHYAVVPYMFNQNVPAALSVNTATHPSHGGRGLFTKLAQRTYKQAFNYNIEFISGVANQNSINVFENKLNFQHLGRVKLSLMTRYHFCDTLLKDLMYGGDLAWRLLNPSKKYYCAINGNNSLIFTKQRGFYVLVGASSQMETLECLENISCPTFFFMPHFGFSSAKLGIEIPLKFMPSPWHVIILDKSKNFNPLVLNGLSLDTF
jgi:hypothetical protein